MTLGKSLPLSHLPHEGLLGQFYGNESLAWPSTTSCKLAGVLLAITARKGNWAWALRSHLGLLNKEGQD